MKKYVIEREMPGIGAATQAQLRAAAESSNEALARLAPDVQWVESYVVDDRTYCVYLARDESRIREHAALTGLPATSIREVRAVIDPTTATAASPGLIPSRSSAPARVGSALVGALALSAMLAGCRAQPEHLVLDVHHVPGGTVKLADVADAHAKDLAVQDAHDVRYERYWVDESSGTIFCLAEAPTADAAVEVHREAHGLLADEIGTVVPGILPAKASGTLPLFMDTHRMGPGLKAADVAAAHEKDLAVQDAHGVRFLEYWVDEHNGVIRCLAEAPNAEAIAASHRHAHGLVPQTIQPVVEGH